MSGRQRGSFCLVYELKGASAAVGKLFSALSMSRLEVRSQTLLCCVAGTESSKTARFPPMRRQSSALASGDSSQLTQRKMELSIDRAVDNPGLKAAVQIAKGYSRCHAESQRVYCSSGGALS